MSGIEPVGTRHKIAMRIKEMVFEFGVDFLFCDMLIFYCGCSCFNQFWHVILYI